MLVMASEQAPNRTVLCAGAGTFEAAHITLTQGIHIGQGDQVPEALAARLPRVSGLHPAVAQALAHAHDVLADRRLFAIDDAAWAEFLTRLDQPVSHKPRLEKLFTEPSIFDQE